MMLKMFSKLMGAEPEPYCSIRYVCHYDWVCQNESKNGYFEQCLFGGNIEYEEKKGCC